MNRQLPLFHRRSRGQALLEFALVLPLLLLIFFIIIEFALLFEAWLVVGLRHGHTIPVVDGIDLNEKAEAGAAAD